MWYDSYGEAAAIAFADAGGAGAGVTGASWLAGVVGAATAGTGYAVVSGIAGVVGASGASYAAYRGFYPLTGKSTNVIPVGKFTTNQLIGTSVIYTFPSKFNNISNYGKLHNDCLEQNYVGQNFTKQNEINWIKKNYTIPSNINIEKLYNSASFQNYKNTLADISTDYASHNYNCSYLLQSLKNKKLITSITSNYLELFYNAQSKSVTFADSKKINDYYVNVVVNSSLSDIDKQSLFSAFTVYIQSLYYWLNFETI